MKHGLFSEEVMPSNILMGHPDPVGEPGEPGVPEGCVGCRHAFSEENPVCKSCEDHDNYFPKVTGEKGDSKDDPKGPTILDSGNRRQFESGAVRDIQEGKGRCDLLPLDVMRDFFYLRSDGISKSADYKRNRVFGNLSNFIDTGDDDSLHKVLIAAEMFHDPFDMFLEVSKHFEEGAKKYGENNWQKGIPVHCYIDSAVRHYLKFLRGDKDEPHDRAFCWNIMCAIWTCKHKPELNEYAVKEEV